MNDSTAAARYDADAPALVITDLTVTHPAVTTEALRWAHGSRGPAEPADVVAGTDLTAFAEQALVVGAQAIAAAGGAQDTFNLEQLVNDVGARTTEAATQATTVTTKVVEDAAKSVRDASSLATKTLVDAGEAARVSLGRTVTEAQAHLQTQMRELFGGEDPQLVARLDAVVQKFTADLVQRTDAQTANLYAAATKALNPDDPSSPLAKHHEQLKRQHAELTVEMEKQREQLIAGINEVKTALAVQKAATSIASVTPLKGGDFEDQIHAHLRGIAVGLGDEYQETGALVGALARCKKGDGVLTIMGGQVRVVIEMTDSDRREWNAYLDESERNRSATASLGLVRSLGQNDGQTIRVLGPRRIVLAFDPETDDPALLRTAVQILRLSAISAMSRQDDAATEVATERISQAIEELKAVEQIRKSASAIRSHAEKVDTGAERLATKIRRLLMQAQTALAGAQLSQVVEAPTSEPTSGAA